MRLLCESLEEKQMVQRVPDQSSPYQPSERAWERRGMPACAVSGKTHVSLRWKTGQRIGGRGQETGITVLGLPCLTAVCP